MIETRQYTMAISLRADFETAKTRTVEALAGEGFGVLSEIDVKETLKRKLGEEFRDYVILGACNPPLAHRALQAEADLGVLMPCNVVVYSNGDATCTVAAIDPVVQFGNVKNPQVEPVAREVRDRMMRVLKSLEG